MYSQTAVVIVSDLLRSASLRRTLNSAQAKQKRDTSRSKILLVFTFLDIPLL